MLKPLIFLIFWLFLFSFSKASDHDLNAEQRFQTIKAAFEELGHRVRTTVLAQVGDPARIELQHSSASHFLDMLHRVSLSWPQYHSKLIGYTLAAGNDTSGRLPCYGGKCGADVGVSELCC